MPNAVRVTLAFPLDLWEQVKRAVPAGGRSDLIAEATRRELRRRQRLQSVDRLADLQKQLWSEYGEMASSVNEIRQMREDPHA